MRGSSPVAYGLQCSPPCLTAIGMNLHPITPKSVLLPSSFSAALRIAIPTCTEQQPHLPLRQAVLGRPFSFETSAPSQKCLLPARWVWRCRGPRVHPLHLPPKRPRRPTVARSRHRCIGTVGQRLSVTSSSFAVTNTPPVCRPSKQQAAWDMDKDVFTQARFVACTVSLLRLARSGQSEASINFELDYHDSRVTNFSARVRA